MRIITPIAVEFIKDFGIECPCKRNKSKGEREVARVLSEMNIPYEEEYTFDDCRDKSLLRFDFKVEVEGRTVLIEFDGIYHFKPVNGDIETFEGQRRRDGIKDKYCIDNDIELIRIKCTDIDKVSDILADKLK